MAEVTQPSLPGTTGFWQRLRGAMAAPEETQAAAVICQNFDTFSPGEAASRAEGAILEIGPGVLTRDTYQSIRANADRLRSQGTNRVGVIVDNQGGGVAGLADAVAGLLELRASVGAGNFFAFNARNAQSAAYALLATAGKGRIFADAGAATGSIGGKMRIEGTARFFRDALLVDVEELTDGKPLKVAAAPGTELTDDQRSSLRDRVADADLTFEELVAFARGDSLADLQRMAGEGATHESRTAVAIGLIDRVMTETEFRDMIRSPSTTEETTMPRAAAGADPPATVADTTAAPAAEPAAVTPTAEAGSPPPAAAAPDIAALTALVTRQSEQIAQLTTTVSAQADAASAAQRATTLAAYRRRIETCVGSALTPSAAAAMVAAVEQVVAAGGDAEALVASAEAIPGIETQAHLSEEVTFPVAGGDDVAIDVDFRQFGVVPGPNGRPAFDREGAIETAGLIQGAKTPAEVMARLEAANRQDGRL